MYNSCESWIWTYYCDYFQSDIRPIPDLLAKEEAISGQGPTVDSVEGLMKMLHYTERRP